MVPTGSVSEGITKYASLTVFLPNLKGFPSPRGPYGSTVQLRTPVKPDEIGAGWTGNLRNRGNPRKSPQEKRRLTEREPHQAPCRVMDRPWTGCGPAAPCQQPPPPPHPPPPPPQDEDPPPQDDPPLSPPATQPPPEPEDEPPPAAAARRRRRDFGGLCVTCTNRTTSPTNRTPATMKKNAAIEPTPFVSGTPPESPEASPPHPCVTGSPVRLLPV